MIISNRMLTVELFRAVQNLIFSFATNDKALYQEFKKYKVNHTEQFVNN